MSIILDALKKLDRERSGRPDGPPNIDTEILRPDPPLRRKKNQLYFATIFLTAVAATAITYAVVVWFGSPPKPLPPASMTSPARKQPVEPTPPEATPAPKSGPPASMDSSAPKQPVIPDPPSQEPARASGQETSQEPSKIKNFPENKGSGTPLGEKKEGQNVIPEKADTVPGNKGKSVGPIPSGSAASPPPLRITAIGWDEDPSKRFAFVNGMMVHEGDTIDEAKIVEIYPKRIRFLHNGQYLEIRM